MGLAPAEFWGITPREILIILGGAQKRQMADYRLRAGLAYSQARLIGIAINDPKKMPAFEKIFPDPDKPKREQSPEESLRAMRAWARSINASFERKDHGG